MSSITTHILDTALGRPAEGIAVTLSRLNSEGVAEPLSVATTNADGRVDPMTPPGGLTADTYRLMFQTAPYFAAAGRESFYPSVEIAFHVADPTQHYHVPLLLSPFGYSTYRGS
ncbi:5-hydroxyisourate hydrolase precursor [Planctomycetes bacterium MalM25]|nr:5-hydroxyisourate hydrolase precursor [Planctomycetes bacterium MalM25]